MARLLSSSWSVTAGWSHDGVSLRSQNGPRDFYGLRHRPEGNAGIFRRFRYKFGDYLERAVKKRKRKISIARIVILECTRTFAFFEKRSQCANGSDRSAANILCREIKVWTARSAM